MSRVVYEAVQSCIKLDKAHVRNHNPLLPPSASAWIRRSLAESLRSKNPYAVNLLLGGFDTTTTIPHLYWIDYLGTKAVVNYGAHGAGMYVALSLMDKWWYEGMDKKAGMVLLHKCIAEVQNRESTFLVCATYVVASFRRLFPSGTMLDSTERTSCKMEHMARL